MSLLEHSNARTHGTVRRIARACSLALLWIIQIACHRERGPRVYVSNEDAGTVTVIDAQTLRAVETIQVGQRPRGLRVSRDGKWLYVALSGSAKGGPGVDESSLPPPNRAADGIAVIDLGELEVVRVLPSGPDPESFDLVGEHALAVSNEETAETSIVDLESRKLRSRVTVGREPEGVTTAPDGTVWVTSESDHQVAIIDPEAARAVATLQTGERPRAVAFTPDGKRALITNENDGTLTVAEVATRRAIGSVKLPEGATMPPRPMGVAIARDGRRAYVTTGRAGAVDVLALDGDIRVLATIADVGRRPWGIAIAGNGRVFTANGPSNDVSAIDPATNQVIARIPAGASPWGVAAAP